MAMSKKICDSQNGITVKILKEILENYPDDLMITIDLLSENFPATKVEETTYKIYPMFCDGVSSGTKKCLKIR